MKLNHETVRQLDLGICHVSELNTRHPTAKDSGIQELALSIKTHGQTTPAIVRPHPKKKGEYEIGAGARRRIACQVAGLATLGCVIRTLDDTAFEELILVENLQREDPDPRAEIELLERLIKRGLHTTAQISAHLGKPAHWVERRRQLMKVIPALRKLWKTRAENGDGDDLTHFTVDMMELLGSLPVDTQKSLAELFENWDGRDLADCSSRATLQAYLDKEVLCRLDAAPFDLQDPKFFVKGCGPGCAMDSSAVSALFDFGDAKGKPDCARCLNPSCFQKRIALFQESKLAELEKEHGKDLPVVSPNRMGWNETAKIGKRDLKPSYVSKILAAPANGARKCLVFDNGALRIGYVPKQSPSSSNGSNGHRPSKKLVAPSVRLKERKDILQGTRLLLVHDELNKALNAAPYKDCTEDIVDLAAIFGLPWKAESWDSKKFWTSFDARKKTGFPVMGLSGRGGADKDRLSVLWIGLKVVLKDVMRHFGNVGDAGEKEPDMRRVAALIKFPFDAEKKKADLKIPPPRSWGAVDVHTLEPVKARIAAPPKAAKKKK